MNAMLAVGSDPTIGQAGGGAVGLAFMGVFTLAGMILLYAALRLIRKRHNPRHHHYTLPRH